MKQLSRLNCDIAEMFSRWCSTTIFVFWCRVLRCKRVRRDRMVVGFTTTYAISAYHH